jgi:signal peptide peptidase SppA
MLRLIQAFWSAPLALDASLLAQAEAVLDRWGSGARLDAAEISAAVGAAPAIAQRRRSEAASLSQGGVAVVPVYGVLVHRHAVVKNVSTPMTSTEAIDAQLRRLVSDSTVTAIVLDVDSPGGSVFGLQELGDTIAALRGSKPIVAVANNTAASGGYWIASQADELVVTPSGMVGSVGVVFSHTDRSRANELAGIKVRHITSGKYKAEGAETGPLDATARAQMQALADHYGNAFVRAVARGRRLPVDVVRGPAFGEGRMRVASDAVKAGMADSIGTLEATVARLQRGHGGRAATARPTPAPRGGGQAVRLTGTRAQSEIELLELA